MYSQQDNESKRLINEYTKLIKRIFKECKNDPI